jgi:hypothetical protein
LRFAGYGAELLQEIVECWRQGRANLDPRAGARLREAQFGGVQKVAVQFRQRRLADAQVRRRSVKRIAHHGMLQRGKVHADLMRAASVELDLDERGAAEDGEGAPIRARGARIRDGCAAPGFFRRGHARAVNGVAADGQLDPARFFLEDSLHQGEVCFLHGALLEGFTELGMRRVVLGGQNHTGSFFVEPMYDSRAQRMATRGKGQAAAKKRVDQSARYVSRARVDGHSGRLVDGNDVFVFVKDFEGDGFGFGGDGGPLVDFDDYVFVAAKAQRAFSGRLAVDAHVAFLDQFLHAGAAELGPLLGQEAVETHAGAGGRNDNLARGDRIRWRHRESVAGGMDNHLKPLTWRKSHRLECAAKEKGIMRKILFVFLLLAGILLAGNSRSGNAQESKPAANSGVTGAWVVANSRTIQGYTPITNRLNCRAGFYAELDAIAGPNGDAISPNGRHAPLGPACCGKVDTSTGPRQSPDVQNPSQPYRTLAPKVTRDSNGLVTDVDFRDAFKVRTEHVKTTKFYTDPVRGTHVRYWTVRSYVLTTPHGSLTIEPQRTIVVFSGADFLRKGVASLGLRLLPVSEAQAAAPTAAAAAPTAAAAGGTMTSRLSQLTSDAKDVYEQFKQANEIADKLQEYVDTAQHYNELYQASQRPPGLDDQTAFLDQTFWRNGIDAALKITDFKGKSEWFEDFLSRFVRFAAYTICQFQGRCVVDASGKTTLVDQAPQKMSSPGFPSYEAHGYICNCGKEELDTMIVGTGAQAAAESAAFLARCPVGMSNFGSARCSAF